VGDGARVEGVPAVTLRLMQPYVTDAMREAVAGVMQTHWIGQGPKVDEFERCFSEKIAGGRPAVAVGSCTDALHLAYVLAGIGEGDEVVAPLFSCTATNIPLLYQRARIQFYDVAPGSLNGSPETISAAVTDRTKAVVVVHYGGQQAKYSTCLPVIEDCAQSLGGSFGVVGDYACYSFQAVKHVTTGDGGMLVCPVKQADQARRMRWFGIDRRAKLHGVWENDLTELGYKYQMTDIGAAMGIAGLESLGAQIEHRRKMRDTYVDMLSGLDGISVLDKDTSSACWLMTVLVERREDLRRKLAEAGIESDQSHYRNDRYSIFARFRGRFPNMDAIEAMYLLLPLHMGMQVADVERVCEVIDSGW
jgi:perosamine synthetase